MKLPWKFILVSLTVGLLLGGSAGLFCGRRLAQRLTVKSPDVFINRLDHELHLSGPQKTRIRVLVMGKREKVAAFQEEIRKNTRAEIRGTLTAEQQPGFDVMMARHDAQKRKREGK